MDFIIHLLKSKGFKTIMIMVDRLTKYAMFIQALKECVAKVAARLFMKHVVKHWGLPWVIISDKDPRFIGVFGLSYSDCLGSSYICRQPYTCKWMAKLINNLLEIYLQHFIMATQANWAKLLGVAQFSFNPQWNESMSRSPFELAMGC
ncbi:DNA-directed DNA polymerase [Bertholletia excelsa]